MRKPWLLVVLFLLSGCTGGRTFEGMTSPIPATAVVQSTFTPSAEAMPATRATSTLAPSPTPSLAPRLPAKTPSATPTLTPTATRTINLAQPVAQRGTVSVVMREGDKEPVLAQVDAEGNTHALGGPVPPPPWNVWYSPRLGAWVEYWEERLGDEYRVLLYNSLTRDTQSIPVQAGVSFLWPAFDATRGRLAYTLLASPGETIDGRHWWVIYVRDLTTGMNAQFGGEWPSPQSTEVMPARPVGWAGNDLLVETYDMSGEVLTGVWALDSSKGTAGQIVTLRGYDRLVLDPKMLPANSWYRTPTVSPDGETLAYLVHSPEYELSCWNSARFGYDLGLSTELWVVPIKGGAPRMLVDVAGEGRALVDTLTWSPDSQRILFAQVQCQGKDTLPELALGAVALQGIVSKKWSLPPVVNPLALQFSWCTQDGVFYQADWGEIRHLDLATGRSQELLPGYQVGLIGCLP